MHKALRYYTEQSPHITEQKRGGGKLPPSHQLGETVDEDVGVTGG